MHKTTTWRCKPLRKQVGQGEARLTMGRLHLWGMWGWDVSANLLFLQGFHIYVGSVQTSTSGNLPRPRHFICSSITAKWH